MAMFEAAHAVHCEESGPLLELANAWLDTLGPEALAAAPSLRRLELHLLRRGMVGELREVREFRRTREDGISLHSDASAEEISVRPIVRRQFCLLGPRGAATYEYISRALLELSGNVRERRTDGRGVLRQRDIDPEQIVRSPVRGDQLCLLGPRRSASGEDIGRAL